MIKAATFFLMQCLAAGSAFADQEVCKTADVACNNCKQVVEYAIENKVAVQSVHVGVWPEEAQKFPLASANINRITFPDVTAKNTDNETVLAHAECLFEKGAAEPSWITVQFRTTGTDGRVALPESKSKLPRHSLPYLTDEEFDALPPSQARFFALGADRISDILNSK